MKNFLKKVCIWVLVLTMVLPWPAEIFAQVNYKNVGQDKWKYVNKLTPVKPARLKDNETAEVYVKDPEMPKLYTVRSDFLVQRGDEEVVSYQPYIATVGDDKYKYKDADGNEKSILSDADKNKINKPLVLPALDGYTSPTSKPTLDIKYGFVNDPHKKYQIKGNENIAKYPFIYEPKESEIMVKHLFQEFDNLEKFGKKPGLDEDIITKQTGVTGTIIRVQPLPEKDRKGYVPENTNIFTQVPENKKDFVVEYRYKRAYFDVAYDTKGKHYEENTLKNETDYGTLIPTRRAFYEQRIPNITEAEIPTKIGGEFLGWMPSVDIKGTINGDDITFKQGEVIKDSKGNAILDLYNTIRAKDDRGNLKVDPTTKKPVYTKSKDKIEIIMSSEKLTFISLWKAKPKADYAIQFWTEKADHADNAKLEDKYEFLGTRVYKDADTGSVPNLDSESPGPVEVKENGIIKQTFPGLKFPDLDNKRLQKIWNGDKFNRSHDLYLNKFYVYNQGLTYRENLEPITEENKNKVRETKTISSTGRTVYNIYYDRQVYTLYFTKSNAQPKANTIYPEIWGYDPAKGESVMLGGPGKPYTYKARFNELMYKWPNDAKQTKGFTPGYQSFGWGPNYKVPNWPKHLDTPPYRLNAEEFLDMDNYVSWGGYIKKIDKGDGTTIDLDEFDFKTLSFGIKQDKPSIPHHMDFWMDGFKPGETIIRYDLVRTKADTGSTGYGHRYPVVQGFTPYGYDPKKAWPSIKEGSEENGRVNEDDIDELNDERDDITPNTCGTYYNNHGIKLPIGQLDFISVFFSDSDDFGDPISNDEGDTIVPTFKENGYLRFKYHRNKYQLRFNYDPSKTRNDSYFNATNSLQTFYEFPLVDLDPQIVLKEDKGIKDGTLTKREPFKIDNPKNLQALGLTDLVYTDPKDDKLKVKRPDNITDQMEFKGWALDPAGTKLVWKNKGEKMPTHPVNLYAKWAEPDFQWRVTFDPDGGVMPRLDPKKLTTEEKKIKIGDIGQDEEKTFPVKGYKKEAPIQGDKQVFTVIQRQKLRDLINKEDPLKSIIPRKKGYEFMGWEVLRYKKDGKGGYTDEIDEESRKAYKEKYKFPEIYAFGNDVVAPIYLKAIWIKSGTIDIPVYHHFLNDKYEEKGEPVIQWLRDRRVGSYLAAIASKQNQERILIPKEEWEKLEKGQNSYKNYKESNGDPENPRVNSYIQQIRIEPEKIQENGQEVDNPKAKNNEFHFYYRPFRKREYKVNYIDDRFKGQNDEKAGAIIDQETVINGKRHFDARNYRPIPGWKLVSAPQQQLIFDINEDTNEFYGINGTGKKEITFYYKDVRVIETRKDDPVPEGYVRVVFKVDEKHNGGVFKDKDGKEVTELYYDVIKGLKSDLLPHPIVWEGGNDAQGQPKQKEEGRYYITPDDGQTFIKWDNEKWLNESTEINKDYTFTAYFNWSGLSSSGMVRTEAFKDSNNKWTNNFAPTIAELKAQVVWKVKDQVKPELPEGTTITLFGPDGNELKTEEDVFNLVKEMNKADTEELFRTVNIKAKAKFKDDKDTQELDIPIKVYKNVYEALNEKGDKPLFLKEAEGKDAKDGGLKNVTGNYVMVTVKPGKDFKKQDTKIYFVNPKAWVEIPEVSPDGSTTFVNWKADKSTQNEDGKFNFANRHKFTEDTVIQPVGAADVVEQTDPANKPAVPGNYVKVTVDKTTNAELGTGEKQTQTFWVNPNKDVTITVTNPKGKTVAADPAKPGTVGYTMAFSKWQSNEGQPRIWEDKIAGKFTAEITIKAVYSITAEKLKEIVPKVDTVDVPQGKEPTVEEITKQITPPAGKTIGKVTIVDKPDVTNSGDSKVTVIVEYTDGSSVGKDKPIEIPVKVHEPIIKANKFGDKPEGALSNYVKVTFEAGEGGTVSGDLIYYVSPEVEVDMTDSADKVTKTPATGYTANGGKWAPEIKAERITGEKTYKFNFVKSDDIVEKTQQVTEAPAGYVAVTFTTEDAKKGKLAGDVEEKVYFVNPEANITLKVLADNEELGPKQLEVPKPVPADQFEFDAWYEKIDEAKPIKGERTYVARFKPAEVTLTYEAGEGATGDVPGPVKVKYGETVGLAEQGNLKKDNAVFLGWKLDGDETIHKAKEAIKLEGSRTATAQWESVKHTVSFDLAQGTLEGATSKDPVKVAHGSTLGALAEPTREGYAFIGWKAGNDDFDPAITPVNGDVKITAQWAKAVEKIDENDSADVNHFVKITFKQGIHGTLEGGEVTYKVAKDLTLDQAKAAGLKVPEINPNKYYKAKAEDERWTVEIKEQGQIVIYTAQYEPEAKVIPIDPKVTPDDKLQDDKPEGMVLVEFKVPQDKAFMTGATKFYVKKDELVNIETPVVHPLTISGQTNTYSFNGWDLTKIMGGAGKFSVDTEITDGTREKPEIKIINPRPNAKFIVIESITNQAVGHLEVIRGNKSIKVTSSTFTSLGITLNRFVIPDELGKLRKKDKIKFYAEKDGLKSKIREYRVR